MWLYTTTMPHPRKRREGKLMLMYGSILVLLLVVFFAFLHAVVVLGMKDVSVEDVRKQKAAEARSVEARHGEAVERLGRLQSPLGREEEYRSMYGLVRPGEEVVSFVDTHTEAPVQKNEGFDILKFFNLRN